MSEVSKAPMPTGKGIQYAIWFLKQHWEPEAAKAVEDLVAATTPDKLADDIERLYSAASENACRCNQPETYCPLCSAWSKARQKSIELLKSATASQQREVERLKAGEQWAKDIFVKILVEAVNGMSDCAIIAHQKMGPEHSLAAVKQLADQLRAERERVKELVESAWREGLSTGHCTDNYYPDEWWPKSKACRALSAPPVTKSKEEV